MAKDYIGYEALTDRALRSVVREALKRIAKQGLIGNHHFYITFKTHGAGVDIPDFLKERYPDEMTIVLQNQYSGLKVEEDGFQIGLSFQKFPATLVIPFEAVTAFADPSVQFGLQFKNATAAKAEAKTGPKPVPAADAKAPAPSKGGARSKPASPPEAAPEAARPERPKDGPQIVSLDKFRKK